MKLFRLAFSLIFLYCFSLSISRNVFKMHDELKKNKDLIEMTDGTMYDLGIFQIWTGIFIYFTTGLLVFLLLVGSLKLFEIFLFSQQMTVLICIIMMFFNIFIQDPTPQTVESMLKNAMSGYGNDTYMTEIVDTTQTLLQCCGVNGYNDWKGRTNLPHSLTYILENGTVAIAPVSCSVIKEEIVDLLTDGCFPSLYFFWKNAVHFLIFNAEVLILFELMILFMTYVIYPDCKESYIAANLMYIQDEDVSPPMPVDVLAVNM